MGNKIRIRRKSPTAAFSGSLIQQNFGESIDKGYLLWDTDTCEHERKFIPNDYGFSSLHISRGELIEERIEDLKLSNDPKKTKVSIVWEEFQENYSVEKEKQIERLVKTKYGCENISVECNFVSKEEELNLSIEDNVDYTNSEDFQTLLKEFVENSEYENEEEVLELAKDIDKKLNYSVVKGKKWHLDKMEVWNLYAFPEKPTVFDFNQLKGVVGIFGKNYSGKSNMIRVLVWILYRKMLGGGDAHRLVNMYTNNEDGGGRIYMTIDTEKYYIERTVKVKIKKDGTPDVTYGVLYKKWTIQEDGEYKWKSVDSEKKATEKTERNNVIVESIGTFEDFTKVVLQAQKGDGDYLSMSQQPKNDLINKYLGLEVFRDRYDYAKKKFNDIKSKQKLLGDPKQYKDKIAEEEKAIKDNEKLIEIYSKEKIDSEKEIEKHDKDILEFTKSIVKVEETKYSTVEQVNSEISKIETENKQRKIDISKLEDWLAKNLEKELPKGSDLEPSELEFKIKSERSLFDKDKESYVNIEKWIKENPKKKEIDIEPLNKKNVEIEKAVSDLRNKLEVSKGKMCPTCKHVEKAPDPIAEKKCNEDIARGEKALEENKKELVSAKNAQTHNNNFDKEEVKLGALKNSLQTRKLNIDKFKKDLESSKGISEIKKHNKSVSENSSSLDKFRKLLLEGESNVEKLNKEAKILEANKDSIEKNKKTNEEIKGCEFEKKGCKLVINQLNEKITESKSIISVSKNNIENFKEKLESIISSEKSYGKYAIYLQATHRDGIPAKIIRRKLPIINHRINSILKNLVDFKIELYIKSSGDIKEAFYFNSMEKDSLPMSMASGAQSFVGSVAIRDALHFVSELTKPSLCIIDEGFGSLDEELTYAMQSVFEYLRNKYKNAWIITHKNEIKDYVDSIIQVSKTREGLTAEQIEENPKAGISTFDISV